ncbi:MAG TPA: MFS transporter, partial [Pirellulales bacterium]
MPTHTELSLGGRGAVLLAAFGGLVFAGVQLGLSPISRPIAIHFLGAAFDESDAGQWLAYYTAAMTLGAAFGGIFLGALGDRIGRTRAMGWSILALSMFAAAGAFVENQTQLLILRFLTGVGVGGVWPNGAALVAECYPRASRPLVAGVVGAGINVGILLLSQFAQHRPITPDDWRWLFAWSAAPALLGLAAIALIPESPNWLAARGEKAINEKAIGRSAKSAPLSQLFRRPLLRSTIMGIVLGTIPLVGAWAGTKWIYPWANKVGSANGWAGFQERTQGCWAAGAVLGSFFGAPIANFLGRRISYFAISLATVVLTCGLFAFSEPSSPIFLPWVFTQGFVATLFFGWLPLNLPQMFPVEVRATGCGIAYNSGRFITACGVFGAGLLV